MLTPFQNFEAQGTRVACFRANYYGKAHTRKLNTTSPTSQSERFHAFFLITVGPRFAVPGAHLQPHLMPSSSEATQPAASATDGRTTPTHGRLGRSMDSFVVPTCLLSNEWYGSAHNLYLFFVIPLGVLQPKTSESKAMTFSLRMRFGVASIK